MFGDQIDVVEYKYIYKENVARCIKMGVPNLPSMKRFGISERAKRHSQKTKSFRSFFAFYQRLYPGRLNVPQAQANVKNRTGRPYWFSSV